MDLIRDFVFFSTLLHCVLALPLPQTDYMAQNYNPYDVSPIPGKDILQIPSYNNKPETKTFEPPFLVTPSWLYRPRDNPDLPGKNKENTSQNNQSGSYKPKLPGTALEAIGMKYPLAVPRVKLGFSSTSGMLPVKVQKTPENKPKPPSKVLKPSSDVSTKPVVIPRLVDKVQSVTPSWLYRPRDNPDLPDKNPEKTSQNNQSGSYKPKLPGTAMKAIGMKYPLAVPRVKLGFSSTSGMLPVKVQKMPENKPEPPRKVPKPKSSSSDVSTKPVVIPKLFDIVQWIENVKNTLTKPKIPNPKPKKKKSRKPDQPDENELKLAKLDLSSIIDYNSQNELPLKVYQNTSPPKHEMPGLVLNPPNFYYTPTNPADTLKALQYTQMYKAYSEIEALKPTNIGYPPANPYIYAEDKLEKESCKTCMPEIPKPTIRYPVDKRIRDRVPIIQHTPPYLPVPVLRPTNFDYYPTKPGNKDTTGIQLPSVPTSMSILRRTQLALMNTVAGLPGGNEQTLNFIRAG